MLSDTIAESIFANYPGNKQAAILALTLGKINIIIIVHYGLYG